MRRSFSSLLLPFILLLLCVVFATQGWAYANIITTGQTIFTWKSILYSLVFESASFFALAFFLGKKVLAKGWNVNYTRKYLQLMLFFFPIIVQLVASDSVFVRGTTYSKFYKPDIEDISLIPLICLTIITLSMSLGWLHLLSEKYRNKSTFLRTCYAALNRPEDADLTLRWLKTELIASYFIFLPILLVFLEQTRHYPHPKFPQGEGVGYMDVHSFLEFQIFLFIPLFVSGIGDALSGIIGTRFGKRHYIVKALMTDQTYTRTLEGSACIFISAIGAILIAHIILPYTPAQLISLLFILPPIVTFAEAKSPHSWDNPFILFAGFVAQILALRAGFFL